MKFTLLLILICAGIVAFQDINWVEDEILSVVLFILCARVVWLVLLRKPMWIWLELVNPGEQKYVVAYIFSVIAGAYILYKTGVGVHAL